MQRFKHKTPIKPEDEPYQHIPPNYGARKQYKEKEDEAPKLNESGKKKSIKLQERSCIM